MCKHEIAIGQCAFCSPKQVPAKSKPKAKTLVAFKKRGMTRRQFEKMCQDCREDFQADEVGCSLQDAAYDMADSLLYSQDIMAYMVKEYNTNNRTLLKEILADNLCG